MHAVYKPFYHQPKVGTVIEIELENPMINPSIGM